MDTPWHPLVAPLVDALEQHETELVLAPTALPTLLAHAHGLSADGRHEVVEHLLAFARSVHHRRGDLAVDEVLLRIAAAAAALLGIAQRASDGFARDPQARSRAMLGRSAPTLAPGPLEPRAEPSPETLVIHRFRRV